MTKFVYLETKKAKKRSMVVVIIVLLVNPLLSVKCLVTYVCGLVLELERSNQGEADACQLLLESQRI